MRNFLIGVIGVMCALGCGQSAKPVDPGPDAAPDLQDSGGVTCAADWDQVAPVSACDLGCVTPPADPPCKPGQLCNSGPACAIARHPLASTRSCAATISPRAGVTGCCVVIQTSSGGVADFFECAAE